MQKRTFLIGVMAVLIAGILMILLAFSIPAIRDRIVWRLDEWRVRIDYALNPPDLILSTNKDTVTDRRK